MIRGLHTLFYSSKPKELRAFFKDKLGLNANHTEEGWLIFDIQEADLGVHPADELKIYGAPSGTHDISFYCDDIEATVENLMEKGVEFRGEIEDQGYGRVTYFKVPGDFWIQLYEPNYSKSNPSKS